MALLFRQEFQPFHQSKTSKTSPNCCFALMQILCWVNVVVCHPTVCNQVLIQAVRRIRETLKHSSNKYFSKKIRKNNWINKLIKYKVSGIKETVKLSQVFALQLSRPFMKTVEKSWSCSSYATQVLEGTGSAGAGRAESSSLQAERGSGARRLVGLIG